MTISLIPQPLRLEVGEGNFSIDSAIAVVAPESAASVAEYLAGWLRHATGFDIPVHTTAPGGSGAVVLRLDAAQDEVGAEGYTLRVTPDGVEIGAAQPAGLFYGVQTLRQLLPASSEAAAPPDLNIPVLEILDKPRFGWRGLMLDVSRHFFPAAFVKKFLDVMALYKFNRLHFHLTDDQGWRIEIKSYPRLTEVGSQRARSQVPYAIETLADYDWRRVFTDDTPYGSYYTQDEIRDIVAYAERLFITVVPEIEMPGHSVAALTSYPELGCVGSGYEVRTSWGIADDVLCAGQDSTYEYVEKVLSEVVDLFPSEYIHIGGDECPKVRWEHCPHCQAKMEEEELADEHELQSYFVRQVEQILEAKGRRLIGWDEILEGGLAPKATVMSWRGASGGIEAATAGHDVVMSPNTFAYLDYYQTKDVANEPLAQPAYLPLRQVYAFDPTEGVPDDKAGHVLGGQGNIWTEWIATEAHLEYMAFPRALAIADAVWSPAPRDSFEDFMVRLQPQLARLEQLGVNYRPPKNED